MHLTLGLPRLHQVRALAVELSTALQIVGRTGFLNLAISKKDAVLGLRQAQRNMVRHQNSGSSLPKLASQGLLK